MAARKNRIKHDQATKNRIRTTQIINRLQAFVFGEIEMTPSQVRASLAVLKKTLLDLKKVRVS